MDEPQAQRGESLSLGDAFVLSPAQFELKPGAKVQIRVQFTPRAAQKYEEAFLMLCDNCEVRDLPL